MKIDRLSRNKHERSSRDKTARFVGCLGLPCLSGPDVGHVAIDGEVSEKKPEAAAAADADDDDDDDDG